MTSEASSSDDGGPDRAGLIFAGIAGVTAVAIGAFGAHGLEERLVEGGMDTEKVARRLAQFDTGARYHLAHAVALLAMAGFRPPKPSRLWRVAGILIIAGIVLFSGSLYLLVLTDTPRLGAITPIGGVAWLAAWTMIAITGWHRRSP